MGSATVFTLLWRNGDVVYRAFRRAFRYEDDQTAWLPPYLFARSTYPGNNIFRSSLAAVLPPWPLSRIEPLSSPSVRPLSVYVPHQPKYFRPYHLLHKSTWQVSLIPLTVAPFPIPATPRRNPILLIGSQRLRRRRVGERRSRGEDTKGLPALFKG